MWRIVEGNAERGGEQTRFVFAFPMLRIKTLISELPNIYLGTFRLGEQHRR
jgi:hypothetical protein